MAWKLMKGNEAIAKSAIDSGCLFYSGYPITPQTEITEYMARNLSKFGGTFVQAESEIAAISMIYGASGAGVRTMTSSSSPGISLKAEGISYLAASDLPCVIVNIVRGGPGLGNVQPAQSDYFQAVKGMGHGDYKIIVYAPHTVQEAFDITAIAFEKSDEYLMPCMIMGDGTLGQMMEVVEVKEECEKKLKSFKKPWIVDGTKRKRLKNVIKSIYINAKELEKAIVARQKRYDIVSKNEIMYEEFMTDDAEIIIVSYGIVARIAKTAINIAREKGIKLGLIRPITLWPFPAEIFKKNHGTVKKYFVVELSMGQMVEDVKLSVNGRKPVYFYGRTGGMIPTEEEVLSEVIKIRN
ncbi:MAG: 3-methyl-2-oxobutanoate dehydrogenase subunit VorB [Clostridiales bacterium]|nr:3-methyl-2-oxobutanoate dehydrogenase subunit VorB [Clostridiales bacterium]